MYFLKTFRRLRYHRVYLAYAFASGLSTLIIPLGTQFLVNKLSLAGIWANTLSFLTIIAIISALGQVFRHGQIILVEYLQREIYVGEIRRWRHLKNTENSHYYFEIYTLLKSFSKTYTDLTDMILIIMFGLSAVVVFHPAFLVLPIVMGITFYFIHRSFTPAFESSVQESNRKYDIYDLLKVRESHIAGATIDYLEDRNKHFRFIRKISIKVSALYAFGTTYTLAMGSYLIHLDQLSVGQLVAAELIVNGIMMTLLKLPNSLESLYDFETSHYKIKKALGSA